MTDSKNTPMKISLVTANLRGGGAERMMVNLANGFAERGYITDLILCSAEGPYLKDIARNVNLVDFKSPRVVFSVHKLAAYLKKVKPDILISTLNRVNIASIIARRISGVDTKVILREASTFSVYAQANTSLWDRIIDMVSSKLYKYGDGIAAVSEGVAGDLINNLKLPPGKVKVVFNPVVDKKLFELASEKPDHPFINNKEYPLIISAGRFSIQKDFPVLIKAFNEVCRQKEARLIILGEYNEGEEQYETIKQLVKNFNLEKKVSFPGFMKNPFSYISNADCFVLSSKWEGLPGVLIQALACGTPVVSTDCKSGPSEILKNGEFGALVPVGDFNALAEKIIETINKQREREKLIKRAEDFSKDNCLDKYINLISDIN